MDVECTPRWFGASTMVWGLDHDITKSYVLGHTLISQESTSTLDMCNSIRAHPYAHPLHIKMLEHYI